MFLLSFLFDQVQSTTGNAGAGTGSGAYQNDSMIQIALSLLATALETGAEHLVRRKTLLSRPSTHTLRAWLKPN